jgi:alanyl-tRNA synthetase
VYPHLVRNSEIIFTHLQKEEVKFAETLHDGFQQFEFAHRVGSDGSYHQHQITADKAFDLYTTYGFPLEIIKEEAEYRAIPLEEGFDGKFELLFNKFKEKSRAGAEQKFKGGLADHSAETTKLHTATHLLNAALRKVLGDHVQQKGSNITAERLRFDFNHTDKMTPEQIKQVEDLVNDAIKADLPVSYHLTTVDGAKNENAIGVFDDRYGSEVKVYVMGPSTSSGGQPFSKEICGGPHVARTSMLGSFKIQKEESSSAGVRRIKATVSGGPVEIEMATEKRG